MRFSIVPGPPISSIIGVSSHTPLPSGVIHALAARCTLTDNAGCSYITCLKRMHECFSVHIDELCSYGTYLLCHESSEDL